MLAVENHTRPMMRRVFSSWALAVNDRAMPKHSWTLAVLVRIATNAAASVGGTYGRRSGNARAGM
jgi:hypothetical protein